MFTEGTEVQWSTGTKRLDWICKTTCLAAEQTSDGRLRHAKLLCIPQDALCISLAKLTMIFKIYKKNMVMCQ